MRKNMDTQLLSIWASLWIWLAALWVAIWQAFFINKIMNILWKNPKMTPFFLTLAILWIALVESSAIYGLVVAMRILLVDFTYPLASIWVWLAIWLTWLWVWIWEWIIVEESGKTINKIPDEKNKIMSFMILFIALVETSAIYWILVSFQILWAKDISTIASIWAAVAIWLAGLGGSIWMWMIARKAIWVFWEAKDSSETRIVVPFAILWIALVEAAVIYGLIIAMNIVSKWATIWILWLWAWLAVWLAWFWVAIWQWLLVSNAISKIWTPFVTGNSLIPITVLWVALVESAAIYWLVVALQLMSKDIVIWINAIWAWLAIWLTGLWAWIGQGYIWYKAMDAISLNKEVRAKIITYLVLFIALLESVAIYGLVLAMNISWLTTEFAWIWTLWVAASIWLAWIWVALWIALLTWNILTLIAKRPEMTGFFVTIAVLWVALVESAAIYGLIVSFQILWKGAILWFNALAAGLSIGLTWLGVWLAEWYVISGSASSMARNPENRTKYLTFMILFVALIEVLAIYGLIISTQILNK